MSIIGEAYAVAKILSGQEGLALLRLISSKYFHFFIFIVVILILLIILSSIITGHPLSDILYSIKNIFFNKISSIDTNNIPTDLKTPNPIEQIQPQKIYKTVAPTPQQEPVSINLNIDTTPQKKGIDWGSIAQGVFWVVLTVTAIVIGFKAYNAFTDISNKETVHQITTEILQAKKETVEMTKEFSEKTLNSLNSLLQDSIPRQDGLKIILEDVKLSNRAVESIGHVCKDIMEICNNTNAMANTFTGQITNQMGNIISSQNEVIASQNQNFKTIMEILEDRFEEAGPIVNSVTASTPNGIAVAPGINVNTVYFAQWPRTD